VGHAPYKPEEDSLKDKALAKAEGTYILIAVRDSGPGLEPPRLNRLFDAFYTTKPQGLGMGLAISRSIIEAHGGRLWAGANVPRGAVFQFTLPIRGEDTNSVGDPESFRGWLVDTEAARRAITHVVHPPSGGCRSVPVFARAVQIA
jgi:histidine kinase/DNA gyrase B/HSP90-like ATPase